LGGKLRGVTPSIHGLAAAAVRWGGVGVYVARCLSQERKKNVRITSLVRWRKEKGTTISIYIIG
jgi:hypothetical protein